MIITRLMEDNSVSYLSNTMLREAHRKTVDILSGNLQYAETKVVPTSIGPMLGIVLSDGYYISTFPLCPNGCDDFPTEVVANDILYITLKLYKASKQIFCIESYRVVYSHINSVIGSPQSFIDDNEKKPAIEISTSIIGINNDQHDDYNSYSNAHDIFINEGVVSLNNISAYDPNQMIEGKVIYKTNILVNTRKLRGGFKLFKVLLMDVISNKIVTSFTHQSADAYFDKVNINDVISIKRFQVKSTFGIDKSINKKELEVSLDSEINNIEHPIGFSKTDYDLINSIKDLKSKPNNSFVDVMGFILFKNIKNNTNVRKKYNLIVLKDESAFTINVYIDKRIHLYEYKKNEIIILTNMRFAVIKSKLMLFSTEYTKINKEVPNTNRKTRLITYIREYHTKRLDTCIADVIGYNEGGFMGLSNQISISMLKVELVDIKDIEKVCGCRRTDCNRIAENGIYNLTGNCQSNKLEIKACIIWKDESGTIKAKVRGNEHLKALVGNGITIDYMIKTMSVEDLRDKLTSVGGHKFEVKFRAQKFSNVIDYSINSIKMI